MFLKNKFSRFIQKFLTPYFDYRILNKSRLSVRWPFYTERDSKKRTTYLLYGGVVSGSHWTSKSTRVIENVRSTAKEITFENQPSHLTQLFFLPGFWVSQVLPKLSLTGYILISLVILKIVFSVLVPQIIVFIDPDFLYEIIQFIGSMIVEGYWHFKIVMGTVMITLFGPHKRVFLEDVLKPKEQPPIIYPSDVAYWGYNKGLKFNSEDQNSETYMTTKQTNSLFLHIQLQNTLFYTHLLCTNTNNLPKLCLKKLVKDWDFQLNNFYTTHGDLNTFLKVSEMFSESVLTTHPTHAPTNVFTRLMHWAPELLSSSVSTFSKRVKEVCWALKNFPTTGKLDANLQYFRRVKSYLSSQVRPTTTRLKLLVNKHMLDHQRSTARHNRLQRVINLRNTLETAQLNAFEEARIFFDSRAYNMLKSGVLSVIQQVLKELEAIVPGIMTLCKPVKPVKPVTSWGPELKEPYRPAGKKSLKHVIGKGLSHELSSQHSLTSPTTNQSLDAGFNEVINSTPVVYSKKYHRLIAPVNHTIVVPTVRYKFKKS